MPSTRRSFLRTGSHAIAVTAAASALPRPLLAHIGVRPEAIPPINDTRLRDLAFRSLDAAKAAGAKYADIRLTHEQERSYSPGVEEHEAITVGVRALVDGYWGFAASPIWSPDEMVRLGRDAVRQAKACAPGSVRTIDLAPAPIVNNGHWEMPVKIHPFDLNPSEIGDHLSGLLLYIKEQGAIRTVQTTGEKTEYKCLMQQKAFGSTDGSYCTQRVFRSSGQVSFAIVKGNLNDRTSLDRFTPTGVGWELFTDQPVRDQIKLALDEMISDMALPFKPVDVGRYTTVFDAWGMAQLISKSLGLATELDRILGYEANASGTSYINDPARMRHTLKMGSPLITVVGNRHEAGGVATARWDDEGVEPSELSLIHI